MESLAGKAVYFLKKIGDFIVFHSIGLHCIFGGTALGFIIIVILKIF